MGTAWLSLYWLFLFVCCFLFCLFCFLLYWLFTRVVAGWLAAAACCCRPGPRERIRTYIPGPGKDQSSKFEVQFVLNAYRFHTIIESKNQTIISVRPSVWTLDYKWDHN